MGGSDLGWGYLLLFYAANCHELLTGLGLGLYNPRAH